MAKRDPHTRNPPSPKPAPSTAQVTPPRSRREIIKWGMCATLAGNGLKPLPAAAAGSAGCSPNSGPEGGVDKPVFTAQGFARLTGVFNQMIEEGLHPGAQLAVYHNGKLLLELAGGAMTPGGRPVTTETLFQIRSTTKALTTMVMMQAYERGRFEFDDPVARHWPEFAANGKGKITIAQILSHRAGIPDGPAMAADKFGQRQTVADAVAAMKPIWEPGSKNGYHAATIGWVCDELLYRWEGKAAPELLQRDVFDPLDLKNIFVGLPREQYARMARMDVYPEVREKQPERARFSDVLNTVAGIGLPLSWVAGVATARDLGRLMCVLADEGSFEGRCYFKPETQALMTRPTNAEGEVDQRLMAPVRWGLGFLLGAERSSFTTMPHPRAVGHSGGSASVAWADPEKRLAVAFLCNRMQGRVSGIRDRAVGDAIYDALA